MSLVDKIKEISKKIPKGSGTLVKGIWKASGGEIHVYDGNTYLHSVEINEDEKRHIKDGGKLIIVHACGTDVHVKLPHFG